MEILPTYRCFAPFFVRVAFIPTNVLVLRTSL